MKYLSLKPVANLHQIFFEIRSAYYSKEIRDYTVGLPTVKHQLCEGLAVKGSADSMIENNAINIIIYSMLTIIGHPTLYKLLAAEYGIVRVDNKWELELIIPKQWVYCITVDDDWNVRIERDRST